MDARGRGAWIGAALLAGAAYLLIGRLFALPTGHVRAWRLAAWIVSGVVYAAHIAYEHFALSSPPRRAAWRAALAAAIGAFALAFVAMLHSWAATGGILPAWRLALVAWPAITFVPAFLVALVAATALARLSRGAGA